MLGKSFLILILLCLLCNQLQAQISIQVVDGEGKQPLSGASIIINNQDSSISDRSGKLLLQNLKIPIHLKVSYTGYRTKEISLSGKNINTIILMEPDLHELEEIMIVAPAFETRLLNSTGSYHLIPGSIIQKSNPVNIADIVNSIPGVYMASGSYNTNRLTIRGIGSRTPYGSNRIKAWYGDIPLTTGDGITNIEDIDVLGIGRIEVIKGPSSALYGSGLGGTIRIFPSSQTTDGFGYDLTSEIASFRTFRNSLRAGYKKNTFSLNLNYNNTISDGYRQNSSYQRNTLLVTSNISTKKSTISILLNFVDLNAGISSSLDEQRFNQSPRSAAKNWMEVKGYEKYRKIMAGISHTSSPGKYFDNKLSLFSSFSEPYESRPFNILSTSVTNFGLRDQISYEREKFQLAIGAEIFKEYNNWQVYKTNKGDKGELTNSSKETHDYSSLFFHFMIKPLHRLTITSGLNISYLDYTVVNRENSEENGFENNFFPVSPSLGLNYKIKSSLHLYSSLSHGFSPPTIEESLLPGGALNEKLSPEQGTDFDLGIRFEYLNRLYTDISFYAIDVYDMVVTKRLDEETFYGVNAGRTNLKGLEVFLKYNILPETASGKSIYMNASYDISRNRFVNFIDDDRDFSGKILPGIPRQRIMIQGFIKPFRNLELLPQFIFTGKMFMNDSNSRSYHSWSIFNLRIDYTVPSKIKKFDFKIYGGINNIFDRKYASMILVNAPSFGGNDPRYYYPGLPANLFLGIKVQKK